MSRIHYLINNIKFDYLVKYKTKLNYDEFYVCVDNKIKRYRIGGNEREGFIIC